jgi:hypothetical protein
MSILAVRLGKALGKKMKDEKRKRVLPHNIASIPDEPGPAANRAERGSDQLRQRISEVRFNPASRLTTRVHFDRVIFIPIVSVKCSPDCSHAKLLLDIAHGIDVTLGTDYLRQMRRMSAPDRMTRILEIINVSRVGTLVIEEIDLVSGVDNRRELADALSDLVTAVEVPLFIIAKDVKQVGLCLHGHAHVLATKASTGPASTSLPRGAGFESLCRSIWSCNGFRPDSSMPPSLVDEPYRITKGSVDKLVRLNNRPVYFVDAREKPGRRLTTLGDGPTTDVGPEGQPQDNA